MMAKRPHQLAQVLHITYTPPAACHLPQPHLLTRQVLPVATSPNTIILEILRPACSMWSPLAAFLTSTWKSSWVCGLACGKGEVRIPETKEDRERKELIIEELYRGQFAMQCNKHE
ncbi:hypothetical protein E2C01_085197 [Portunus trituberculatus]|uniref:Uncharacterized protein n=1 Tax=Portunus trituberculatus TaxID=210409 RepID=A0A5B7J6Y3_PORTR|nr:hypothetical protein [Portunus trituberculatus]